MKYKCDVCNVYEYDDALGDASLGVAPGVRPNDLPSDWKCPICQSDKTHLIPQEGKNTLKRIREAIFGTWLPREEEDIQSSTREKDSDQYLDEWKRRGDKLEGYMKDIHEMSVTGKSIVEPMRTKKSVISWDNILFLGAQLAKMPLNEDEEVSTKTIIGPKAKKPLEIEAPIYITHMSFGALSKEIKIALARGSAAVKTAMCSGEGGILKESMNEAYKYIFEIAPNKYSLNDENLKNSDAIEIKIGQSAKPGMGGHLPAEKVTLEIAKLRGYNEGEDIVSPARFEDIKDRNDLKSFVGDLRTRSEGRPIGIKIAAGHIEADLEYALFAEPDFITIDGRPGATAAAPKFIKGSTSVPTLFALHRARKYFKENNVKDVSLVITGGFRVSSDIAKALAMGADAVALGTSVLMACACQQYRICQTGDCPVGVTTQKDDLRSRIKIDASTKRLENFLKATIEELKQFARLTGNDDVHKMSLGDICTDNSEISEFTDIKHV